MPGILPCGYKYEQESPTLPVVHSLKSAVERRVIILQSIKGPRGRERAEKAEGEPTATWGSRLWEAKIQGRPES